MSLAFDLLQTDGPGDRTSTAVLPLATAAPTVAKLPNYDTDRDGSAGLVIAKGGTGATETNAKKYQKWSLSASTALTLSGTATLTLWSSTKEFASGKRGVVTAFLLDCPASGTGCTTIHTVTLDVANWNGGSATWVSKTLDFGAVSYTVAAGRLFRVMLIVGSAASDSMWFAYDTTAYPTVLTIA